MQYFVPDDAKLHFEEDGHCYPIIFLFESSAMDLQLLAGNYRCLTYNARGFPPSNVHEERRRHKAPIVHSGGGERVARASASAFVLGQDALIDQVLDVAVGRVLRALVNFAHFDEVSLPSNPSSSRLSISRCRSLNVAPACPSQNRAFRSTLARVVSRAVEGAVQAAEEPLHPGRDVEVALLGALQDRRSSRSAPRGSGRTCCRSAAGSARSGPAPCRRWRARSARCRRRRGGWSRTRDARGRP